MQRPAAPLAVAASPSRPEEFASGGRFSRGISRTQFASPLLSVYQRAVDDDRLSRAFEPSVLGPLFLFLSLLLFFFISPLLSSLSLPRFLLICFTRRRDTREGIYLVARTDLSAVMNVSGLTSVRPPAITRGGP